jgi:UTP--glucose-1-phosphate uridylyltransferase
LDQVEEIREIGRKLSLAVQEEPKGFGHAVLCTEGFIGSDEWFLLLLGDHLYTCDDNHPLV